MMTRKRNLSEEELFPSHETQDQPPLTSTPAPPRASAFGRMGRLLSACAVALSLTACGSPDLAKKDTKDRAPQVTDTSPNDGTDKPTPSQDTPIPKVDMKWGNMDLAGRIELKLHWNDQIVFLQHTDEGFTLWSTSQFPESGSKVAMNELFTQEGQMLNLATRNGKLLMLYQSLTSTVLQEGTLVDGKIKWVALRTHALDDENAPIAMQRLGHEILLFGRDDLLRVDWDTREVIEVPIKLPGKIKQAQCRNNQCVALFENQETPMWLTPKYEWKTLTLLDKKDLEPANDDKAAPHDRARRISLRGKGMIYVDYNRVYFTCNIPEEPLREITNPNFNARVFWLNGALASINDNSIELQHGDKRARLELPEHLRYLKPDAYKLTRLDSINGYVLLVNDEMPSGYKRFSLAYQPDIAADNACKP